jgi:hypothetical protein
MSRPFGACLRTAMINAEFPEVHSTGFTPNGVDLSKKRYEKRLN